jgi:hypothetical protein
MDEHLSHDAKKIAKNLEALKKAESAAEVADYLEIVDDSSRSLVMRVHRRKFKTKVAVRALWGPITVSILPIAIGTYFHFSFSDQVFGRAILFCVAPAALILAACVFLDENFSRYTIIVDIARGIMNITHIPFQGRRRALMLDHISKFGRDLYWNSIHAVLIDVTRPGTVIKKDILYCRYYAVRPVEAIVARLNYTLEQYRRQRELPL